jgi:predicted RNase H-like HicB family nuclease
MDSRLRGNDRLCALSFPRKRESIQCAFPPRPSLNLHCSNKHSASCSAFSRTEKQNTARITKEVNVSPQQIYNFSVLIEKDEDGYYIATVPALKSCYTQAKTLEELYPRIKEVIGLCLEEEPDPGTMEFVGVQRIEVTV